MAQWIKNPPVVQETQEAWVPSVGWEDPLEMEILTIHSSILALKTPWTEKPGRLQSKRFPRVRYYEARSRL